MRTLRTAAALVLGGLTLAACGGEDPAPANRSAGGGRPPTLDAKTKKAMLDFARCMREHGVDMPDPKFDQGGGAMIMQRNRGMTPEQQRAAEQACAKYQRQVKPPPMSEEDQAKFRKEALAHAKCMRAHGIDMPDPQFGERGEVQQRIGGGMNPTDPKFQAAEKACGGGLIGGRRAP
jgi:hypothetical protein